MPGTIFTPLGVGKIVYKLPSGQYLVEFPHGGGHLFYPQELFPDWEDTAQDRYDKSDLRLAA